MNSATSVSLLPDEILEMINSLETTYTAEEIYVIYEEWLTSMEFSPDYIIN